MTNKADNIKTERINFVRGFRRGPAPTGPAPSLVPADPPPPGVCGGDAAGTAARAVLNGTEARP
nr:hypothetical protein Ade03nite_18070 [Actinoplanes derwentensis]